MTLDEVMAKAERDVIAIIDRQLDNFDQSLIECGMDPEVAAQLSEFSRAKMAEWRSTTLPLELATIRQRLLDDLAHRSLRGQAQQALSRSTR